MGYYVYNATTQAHYYTILIAYISPALDKFSIHHFYVPTPTIFHVSSNWQ